MTVDISTDGIRLRSKTLPSRDEHLECKIRSVGHLKARVAWVSACDFAIRLVGADPPPGSVAQALIALSREQTEMIRIHRRITPRSTGVQVSVAGGPLIAAEILNLSASGVALRLDPRPAVGEVIIVGSRQAIVTRHLEHGVGAAFLDPLDPRNIHEHTVL